MLGLSTSAGRRRRQRRASRPSIPFSRDARSGRPPSPCSNFEAKAAHGERERAGRSPPRPPWTVRVTVVAFPRSSGFRALTGGGEPERNGRSPDMVPFFGTIDNMPDCMKRMINQFPQPLDSKFLASQTSTFIQ